MPPSEASQLPASRSETEHKPPVTEHKPFPETIPEIKPGVIKLVRGIMEERQKDHLPAYIRGALEKFELLMTLCFKAANRICDTGSSVVIYGPAERQAVAVSLFIQVTRSI